MSSITASRRTLAPIAITVLCAIAAAFPALAVSSDLVISQVYGGGNNAGATYRNDFVEIFNRGASSVSLNGKSIQYASATGTGTFSGNSPLALPNVTVQAGQYYLVQFAGGTTNGIALPTADATGTINLSGTGGKVALVNSATGLACNGGSDVCDSSELALIIDLIGWGTANFFEGAVGPATSNTTSVSRAGNGCTDTDANNSDFTAGTPAARNTATTLNPCSGGSTSPSGVGASTPSAELPGNNVLLTVTVTAGTGPASTGLAVSADLSPIGGSATQAFFDDATNGDVTSGDKIFSFDATIAALTTPGAKTINASITDAEARSGSTTISLTVQSPPVDIWTIQGSGTSSTLAGVTVTTSGVVTLLKSNGFFMQAPEPGDGDVNTSDGIFVYVNATPTAAVGDAVTVSGTVVESFGLTEISTTNASVSVTTTATVPSPYALTTTDLSPSGSLSQLEFLEGMRVSAASLTTVAPTNGFGEVATVITGVARPFREEGIAIGTPPPAEAPITAPRFDENPEKIVVDTNARAGATSIAYTSNVVLTNVVGALDYNFGEYKIDNEGAITATANMVAIPAAAAAAGELAIASFNAENFFSADASWATKLPKASLVIQNVVSLPDMIGMQEVYDLTTLQALATRINTDAGLSPGYAAILLETDIDAENDQDVGVLYDQSRVEIVSVTQEGIGLTFTNPDTSAQEIVFDRAPLVVETLVTTSAAPLVKFPVTVIVNHLRSLIDVELDSAAGRRVRAKRRAGAEGLTNIIGARLTANSNERLVVFGDMNAFIVNDGYVDVINTILGTPTDSTLVTLASPDLIDPDLVDLASALPADEQYSFSFEGHAQILDHMIVNDVAQSFLTGFTYARNNADFPVGTYQSDTTRPERVSDHDLPVSYFSSPIPTTFTVTAPASVMPGAAFNITVTAVDGGGATAVDYVGTVAFTSSDLAALLPANYTFTAADQGTRTFSVTLNTPGSRTVTATDTLATGVTGFATITVNCPGIVIAATNSSPTCANGAVGLSVTTVPGATYSWAGPGGFSSTQQNPTIQPAVGGLYTVSVDTGNGCISTASTMVQIVRAPSAFVSGGGAFCEGSSAQLTVRLTGTAPFSIVWSDRVRQDGIMTSTITRAVAPPTATTYSVLLVTDASCSAEGTGSATITPQAPPKILSNPGSMEIRPGERVTLTVSAEGGQPLMYQWYIGRSGDTSKPILGEESATIVYGPVTATTELWVRVSNSCGAVNSETSRVKVQQGRLHPIRPGGQ